MSESTESPASPVFPRPSATVMLVRDDDGGIEVFLMKRSAFGPFGGLHVFPGGKVDAVDHAERWGALAQGPDDLAASRTLGVEMGGLGYWVACIRECFEEAGVLLAMRSQDEILRFDSAEARARFADWRKRLNEGEDGALEAMCHAENLALATDQLAYVSHWITPIDQPKRFSTRFFVARAPAKQHALHDGFETIDSVWMRPEQALEEFDAGQLNLISPTFKNLQAISGFSSTEALLDAKRAVDPTKIPTIMPRMVSSDSGVIDEILDVVGHGGQVGEDSDVE